MGGGALREIFQNGEKVLCYHSDLLYEAKCLGSKMRFGELVYRIHYIGWSKNWDTWSKASQIRKRTEENLQLKDELMAKHNIDSFGRDRKTKTEKISRKRKITKAVKNDETETGSENSDDTIEHSSDLMLPESLIELLLRDQEYLATYNMVSSFNHEMSVKYIFELFEEECNEPNENEPADLQIYYEESKLNEFKKGIILYFDALMPKYLLYPDEVIEPDMISPNEFCTIVHLLRFLIKLPEFISPLLSDPDVEHTLMPLIKKFLAWLSDKVVELEVLRHFDEFYELKKI